MKNCVDCKKPIVHGKRCTTCGNLHQHKNYRHQYLRDRTSSSRSYAKMILDNQTPNQPSGYGYRVARLMKMVGV